MASIAKLSGKSKKEVRKCLELTDKQIDEGMERIAQAMRRTMISFRDMANAMHAAFQLVGDTLRKELKEINH